MASETLPLILVADDDVRTARRLALLLREDGYAVEVVGDGAAAIARLSQPPPPDVLITDMQLPHVDGRAVAGYARKGKSDVFVIFVTGNPELVGTRPDEPVEGWAVFTKPLDYDALRRELAGRCPVKS